MRDLIIFGDVKINTLVAITPEEHMKGLMYKKWPPPAMVFPYNFAAVRKFWMKNTLTPLDILFCRENKIISICHGEPLSTRMIGPDEPSDLVIELPSGTARKCGLFLGQAVSIEYSQETIEKLIKCAIGRPIQ